MLILSHRGYWKTAKEKNTLLAFKRSFNLGFGTELDVRDDRGRLVVSHDIPDSKSTDLKSIIDTYSEYDTKLCLAINIKADGLQSLLYNLSREYQIENYFIFDMAVPDAIAYLNLQMKVFTRESEFETVPSFYNEADGVWMDEFISAWITQNRIQHHFENGKKVCF